MQLKKLVSSVGAIMLIMQSPLQIVAADYVNPDDMSPKEAFLQGFVQGLDNPEEAMMMLEDGIDTLELSPREQFHVSNIVKQFELIIDKAPTNEARIQKALNTSVYLLDLVALHGKGIIQLSISSENDPAAKKLLKQQLAKNPFVPKLKIMLGVIMEITEKYLGPDLEEYTAFMDELADEPNQADVTLVVQKFTALTTMIDDAFENYAPTINELMKQYVGISTTELFHHSRVVSFMGLKLVMDQETQQLDPEDDMEEINEMKNMISFLQNALPQTDAKTVKSYNAYLTFTAAGGTLVTYWDSIKSSFKPDFAAGVDTLIGITQTRMGAIQEKAKDNKRMADITQIGSALAVYYSDHGTFKPLAPFKNADELRASLVEETNYMTEIPQDTDYPYYFSTLQRNKKPHDAIVVMTRVDNPQSANWIDEDGMLSENKNLSAVDSEDIEKATCYEITIGEKDSLDDCTATSGSNKLMYIYTY